MATTKFLDSNGVTYLWSKIKAAFQVKIDGNNPLNADYVTTGTTNKILTNTEYTALDGKVSDVKVNGVSVVSNKEANIALATDSTAGVLVLGDNLSYNASTGKVDAVVSSSTVPVASTTARGAVKIGDNISDTTTYTAIVIDSNEVIYAKSAPTIQTNGTTKTPDANNTINITASDLGVAGAFHFAGTATAISQDGTTLTVDGQSVVAGSSNIGYVYTLGTAEYASDGATWKLLGYEGVYKTIQTAVSDPTASGYAITFIDTLSQDTNGVITATKKYVSYMSNDDIDAAIAAAV